MSSINFDIRLNKENKIYYEGVSNYLFKKDNF